MESGVAKAIVNAIKKVSGEKNVLLEFPPAMEHGDYATNIAMLIATRVKVKEPRQIADEIVKKLQEDKKLAKVVSKIEVAGPGFINFWLSKQVLIKELKTILEEKESYGESRIDNRTIELEHTSPNTIKTLHLGHVRNNVLGMSVGRLLQAIGNRVIFDAINNDRGIHVMKANWAYLQYGRKNTALVLQKPRGNWKELLSEWSTSRKSPRLHNQSWRTPQNSKMKSDSFVDQFYVLGVKAEKEYKSARGQMQEMLRAWEAKDKVVRDLWLQIRDWVLEGFKETYMHLGSYHDKQWFESELYEGGKKLVDEGIKKGVFRRLPDGAILTNLEKYGLTDTVVVRKDGTALYMTFDPNLTAAKREEFKADYYIWDIGPEQTLYLKQLFAVCEQLGIGKREDYYHLSYGYVYLKGKGRMSSRAGTVISADWLMDEMVSRAGKIIAKSETSRGLSQDQKHKVAQAVGIGAIKYGFLKVARETDIYFDINESLSLEGNSGPYLQYTYARTQSVLRKSKRVKGRESKSRDVKLGDEEMMIARYLSRFPEVIVNAAKNYSPNLLCNFLFELAQKYNAFYNKNRIIGTAQEKERLLLTAAVGQVIKNGLSLLGIDALEKM